MVFKKIIFVVLPLFVLVSCDKKKPEKNLAISGNVLGLKKGTLYIQRIQDSVLVAIDTIKIDGQSSFETQIEIKSPEMLYLFLDRGVTNSIDNNLPFFAEPGKIRIETTLEHFMSDAHISGSKNQELYVDYRKINSRFVNANLDYIALDFKAYKEKNNRLSDSLSLLKDNNWKRKYLNTVNFALNHKDHEIAPFLALSEIADINLKYLDTIAKTMSPKVAKSLYGKKLIDYIAKRKLVEKN